MTGYPYSEFDGGEDAVVTRRFAPVPEADRRRARRWLPVVRAIAAAHAPKEANR